MGRKSRRAKDKIDPAYRLYATILADSAARKLLPGRVDVRVGRRRITVIFADEQVQSGVMGFADRVSEEE